MKKLFKPGRIVVLLVILFGLYVFYPIRIEKRIMIEKGDTYSSFFNQLDPIARTIIKIYDKFSHDAKPLQVGLYEFTGSYSKAQFFAIIDKGPGQIYEKLTILEGRSIYDTDKLLTSKNLIKKDEYVNAVSDSAAIAEFAGKYKFLNGTEKTLEGFLYPETYFVDVAKPVLPQILSLQLATFDKKIWSAYQDEITNFSSKLSAAGYEDLNFYETVTLASVIEKEERTVKNKPIIAGVFLNRLRDGMRLDADITLCYGIHEGYEDCSPETIVKNLYDASNPYNTRQVGGLPPTPISNISENSFRSLLRFEKTDNIYYLHDAQGQIHFGATIQEHNNNKSKYLNN